MQQKHTVNHVLWCFSDISHTHTHTWDVLNVSDRAHLDYQPHDSSFLSFFVVTLPWHHPVSSSVQWPHCQWHHRLNSEMMSLLPVSLLLFVLESSLQSQSPAPVFISHLCFILFYTILFYSILFYSIFYRQQLCPVETKLHAALQKNIILQMCCCFCRILSWL